MQNNESYISQLAGILPIFRSLQNLAIDEENSINAYNFDCIKKETLCNLLSIEEKKLKSADGFYYDENASTVYLIEWTKYTDQRRTPLEFVEKFAQSLLILGFLTGCSDLSLKKMNIKCWAIRNERRHIQRVPEFSKLETCLRTTFLNAEVRYNNANSTKNELLKIQSENSSCNTAL